MSREIKFKAEYEGKVYTVAVITNKKVQMYGVSGWVDRAKVTLLQFTGCQDIHNIDIYEGDIDKNLGTVTWAPYNDGEYLHNCETFLFEPLGKEIPVSDAGNSTQGHEAHKVEIIGNIHENSEMLEAFNETLL